MKVEPLAPRMTFDEFCETHGLDLVAHERPLRHNLPRWHVSSPGLEIMGNGILTSTFGDGDTPEEAKLAYAERLRGERLVVNAYREERREFNAPNEWG